MKMKRKIFKLIIKLLTKFMSKRGFIQSFLNKLSILIHRLYENHNYDFFTNGEKIVLKKIKSSNLEFDIIFDVGANVGSWSLMFSNLFPKSKIYSFEVLPSTFEILLENTKSNTNIIVENIGLSDKEEKLIAYSQNNASGLTTLVENFSENFHGKNINKTEVKVMKGSDYAKKNNIDKIDFIKIDVEGYEDKVLKGLESLIRDKKVKVIQFEYGFVNIKSHFLLYDFHEFFEKNDMLIGKIYPNYVDFKDYKYQDENFLGPNYLAVRKDLKELVKTLETKN